MSPKYVLRLSTDWSNHQLGCFDSLWPCLPPRRHCRLPYRPTSSFVYQYTRSRPASIGPRGGANREGCYGHWPRKLPEGIHHELVYGHDRVWSNRRGSGCGEFHHRSIRVANGATDIDPKVVQSRVHMVYSIDLTKITFLVQPTPHWPPARMRGRV